MKKIADFIFRYRLLLAVLLVALGVLFNLNGSSISLWSAFGAPEKNTGLLAGEARVIRTDEWGTLTPMTISQSYGNEPYAWTSDILRGTDTDVFMVYSLPVRSPAVLFHPFQIGYLFFGPERGLSFFWCGRLIFLLLVTFDFLRVLTGDDRILSLAGAFLTTFSPVVQWWFAINGLVEMLLFGELIIICADRLMNEAVFAKRVFCMALIGWSAGCYALTMYPAWMIPLAYVFLAIFIWVILKNKAACHFSRWDISAVICTLAALALSLGAICYRSREVIDIVMHTDYPGSRVETGGGWAQMFFFWPAGIFFAWQDIGSIPVLNVCEASLFFSFAPLGLLLSIFLLGRRKGREPLTILLLIAYAILTVYSYVGLPGILAKITLLSKSRGIRAAAIVSFLDILLLLRAVSEIRKDQAAEEHHSLPRFFVPAAAMLSAGLSVLLAGGVYAWFGPVYISKKKALALCLFLCLCFAAFLSYAFRQEKRVFTAAAACSLAVFSALASGIAVNPLQQGFGDLYETDLAKEMRSLTEAEPEAKWLVANGISFPAMNYPLMMGARTINCTNTYPNLTLWKAFDPDGRYRSVYNRYAYIYTDIVPEAEASKDEKFSLQGAVDNFHVKLSPEELKAIGVSYVLSKEDLEEYSDANVSFECIFEDPSYSIFAVK